MKKSGIVCRNIENSVLRKIITYDSNNKSFYY